MSDIKELTLFMCGRRSCEHDYSGEEEMTDELGRVMGSTAVCCKCGVWAYNEDMWTDI